MQNSIVCRLCTSERFEPHFTKDGYRIQKCLQCGLTQVTNPPLPSAVEFNYDQAFFDKYYQQLQTDTRRQEYEYKKFTHRLEEIEKWAQDKSKILDIGCSFGFFLNSAQKRGWEAYGIEISGFDIRPL